MFFKLFIAAAALCCTAVLAEVTSYEGYKIYDIKPQNAAQQEILQQLAESGTYDFFTHPRVLGLAARVMVAPEEQSVFEQTLQASEIEHQIINENFGETVATERMQNNFFRNLRSSNERSISFSAYQRYEAIDAYLQQLAADYPSRVYLKTIGKSYEGRALRTITITNGDGVSNKKVILLDAGIHAREWIAPAGALYVIQQLVENFAENAHLLQTYDWVILPVVNPDGYEYTHTTTRMWRKTRKPVSTNCYGTDGNRNFDFHWGEVGASSYTCADTFKGKTAFSEPETQALRDLMHTLTGRATFYLTLHSYGNYLLYPWGWTSDLPDTWRALDEVAQAGYDAIKAATGTVYSVGSSTNVLYAAAGGSDDYAFAAAEIPISITMELPAAGNGFDPAPTKILELVSETWIGIKAMAEKVIESY
ncbi:carboxypeptidase B-like [Rhagoletis pomonella]|uniref:carboxypeptidase B-like n=1 Tax=Rhagoletis pomonella TaxID=28610 RepID=UPI0017832DFA|nr:carboxypeptidase B-like [Rhagoletis pomonella]